MAHNGPEYLGGHRVLGRRGVTDGDGHSSKGEANSIVVPGRVFYTCQLIKGSQMRHSVRDRAWSISGHS